MAEKLEKRPSARGGGLLGTRSGSISAAQKAAANVVRRSTGRGVVESPRGGLARTTFRGRTSGGLAGRGRGTVPAPASNFLVGQLQGTSAPKSPATQRLAPVVRGGAAAAAKGRAGFRSPLFNIRGHLGVGGAEGRVSPRRLQRQETDEAEPEDEQEEQGAPGMAAGAGMPFSRPKSAARTRGQPLAALTTAVDTLVDEEEEEMTPEQIKAEKQAALQSMHTFGGASRGPPTIKSPAAASGPGPRASFPFGQQPKAGIAAANPSGGATPSAIQSAQHSELSEEPKHGATIFGRLGTPSSTPPPNLQTAQASETSGMRAAADASAKLKRSQRFGASLQEVQGAAAFGAPSAGAFAAPASVRLASPEPTADDADAAGAAMMDDDGGGIKKGTIKGTCTDMCPASEIERRERIEDISSFERFDPSRAETTTDLAVKKFARNIEQQPENFRTMGALQRTMAHLRRIMDRQGTKLVEIHKFLWDRFRGVRQDLFVQGFEGPDAIKMYEEHIRFMILAEHELCEETTAAADQEAFNSHLNLEQINKALISLNAMYVKHRANGTPITTEVEFRAYHLLTLIGTHGRYGYNAAEFQNALAELCPEVLMHGEVQRVLAMQQALGSGAWVAFLGAATHAPYLQGCLAHMYFPGVRARALSVLASTGAMLANRGLEYPLEDLTNTLQLNSLEHAAELCEAVGLEMTRNADNTPVAIIPKGFKADADKVPRRRSHAISAKAQRLRSQVAQSIVPDPEAEQRAQELAQQQMARVQAWRAQQEAEAAARLAAQQAAMETARLQAAVAAAAQQAARESAQRQAAAAQAEAERLARLEREAAAAAEAARQRKERERAAAEAARAEAERLRSLEEQRLAEEHARAAAAEARRREEARRQAELAAKRAEEERLRRERLERERLERERLRRQAEGLKEVACKRQWRLARDAARAWKERVRLAREARAAEERLLNALKRVRVGVRPRPTGPFRGPDAVALSPAVVAGIRGPQRTEERASAMRGLLAPLDMPQLLKKALAERQPGASTLFWKLVLLQSPSTSLSAAQEWMSTKLLLNRETDGTPTDMPPCSIMSSSLHGHIPSASRNLHVSVSDASAAAAKGMAAITAGSSALLLHITEGDNPESAHQRLSTVLKSFGTGVKVPLLVVSSSTSVAPSDLEHWLDGVAASDANLSQHISERQVVGVTGLPSVEANRSLQEGLLWLAAHSPQQPTLKAVEIKEVVRDELRARTAVLGGASMPASWVAAFNDSLAAAEELASAAASSEAATWRWPPPELARAEGTLPADWHDPAVQASSQQALRSLRLPHLPRLSVDEDIGQRVLQYVQDALGSAVGAGGSSNWRGALSEAFSRRILALEALNLPPAVVRDGQHRRHLPALPSSALHPGSLPSSLPEPGSPPRKRKWTGSAERPAALKAAAHGARSPLPSMGSLTARAELPSRTAGAAAAMSRSSEGMADLFADVPSSAGSAVERGRAAAAARLAALQQDIEARLELKRRLVEQGCGGVPGTPAADASTSEPRTPAAMQTPASSGSGVLVGTSAEQYSEIDKERALTAFLERAVMSC